MKPIPSLDGMRALSVSIVLVAHAGLGSVVPGGLGVTIFFFLSGFLITSLMRVEFASTNGVNIRQFYMRRFLRLGPPLLITLVIAYALVVAGIHPGGATLQGFLAQMFYFANYFELYFDPGSVKVPYGTGILWSLAVEEHFYLLFPLVFLFIARRFNAPTMSRIFAATCVAVLGWRMYLASQPGFVVERTYYASDTRLDSILLGSIFALHFDATRAPRPGASFAPRDMALFAAGVLTLLATLVVRDPFFRETFRYSLQGLALMPVFYCAITYADHPLFRPLNWAWMKRIGLYSYAIYLSHYVAIASLQRNFDWAKSLPLVLGASAAISIVYAAGIERFVESRLRVLRKRMH